MGHSDPIPWDNAWLCLCAAHEEKLKPHAAAVGFWIAILFLLVLDRTVPHLHMNSSKAEGLESSLQKTTMLVLAVTPHNLPEGMAVGVVYAGWLSGDARITAMGALTLSIGIAIQNFPEGAIISMPLRAKGVSKKKAFLYGALSGVVEPVGAALTILVAGQVRACRKRQAFIRMKHEAG